MRGYRSVGTQRPGGKGIEPCREKAFLLFGVRPLAKLSESEPVVKAAGPGVSTPPMMPTPSRREARMNTSLPITRSAGAPTEVIRDRTGRLCAPGLPRRAARRPSVTGPEAVSNPGVAPDGSTPGGLPKSIARIHHGRDPQMKRKKRNLLRKFREVTNRVVRPRSEASGSILTEPDSPHSWQPLPAWATRDQASRPVEEPEPGFAQRSPAPGFPGQPGSECESTSSAPLFFVCKAPARHYVHRNPPGSGCSNLFAYWMPYHVR